MEGAKFESSSECIELITKPPTGIFHLLDKETAAPDVREKKMCKICDEMLAFCFALGKRCVLPREMPRSTPDQPLLHQTKEKIKQVWD